MKGIHHLSITLLTVLPPALPWVLSFPALEGAALTFGLIAGSLAPDVDAPDALVFHLPVQRAAELRVLFSAFGYLLRYLIYYPLSLLFRLILGRSYRHEHRGLLHTPLGVTLMTVILLVLLGIASLLLHTPHSPLFPLFGIAFLGGSLLHLLEDSATPTGIAWAFPVSAWRLRGGVRTTGTSERRPLLLILLLTAIAIVTGHAVLIGWSGIAASLAAIALLTTAWSLFFFWAGVIR